MEDKNRARVSSSPERLVNLFEHGLNDIPVKKSDDIFRQLESRALSQEEQDIIQKRVTHLQGLYEEYAKREEKRKVKELQRVCEGLSRDEALSALRKCDNNEDEAALQLTSGTAFLNTIREKLNSSGPSVLAASETASRHEKDRTRKSVKNINVLTKEVTSTRIALSWGKRATRSVDTRIPVRAHQLATIKAAITMPSSAAETCLRSRRRSSRLQSRMTELLKTEAQQEGDGEIDETESSEDEYRVQCPRRSIGVAGLGDRAISKSGYTCRGRVKQKAQKRVELVDVGELNVTNGWYNAGYIFPLGFKSKTSFRSSLRLNEMCVHECAIIKGVFWPSPTFLVRASDRPHEPLIAKSCTGSWNLVLKRINGEIERRRKAGEDLPPPPKTAIAGPEYFGLVQEDSVKKIEALDPSKECGLYWSGKREREIALQNLFFTKNDSKALTDGKKRRSKCSRSIKWNFDETDDEEDGIEDDEEEEGGDDDDDDEIEQEVDDDSDAECRINQWSSINRNERYKRRCLQKGMNPDVHEVDHSNPLPNLIDPITLETVVAPAISPYGHVMGIATWRAYLMNKNVCPITKKPLTIEQCALITKHNIHKYKDVIKQQYD